MEHRDDPPAENPTDAGADASPSPEAGLASAREEAERYRERWVRERADLENLKRRAERERGEAARYGAERLARDLLPVLDDLERALRAAEETPQGPSLLEGVRLVAKAFVDALTRHGVTRVPAAGHRFDPAHHEAVAHVPSEAHEPGMVVEEHRGGFLLSDRLLRPAMVTVSKGPGGGNDLAKPEGRD